MNKHIHFIGIGGIGMSGIAQLYLEKGVVVSGSDLKMSPITEKLISQGAKIYIGHSPANINGADTVIYSSAIKDDNPEFIEVAKRNITVLKRAEALAGLMQEKVAITISGAHGKTTTTSMISSLLEEAGLAPTVASGGIVRNFKTNAWSGSGKYFVAEADESDGSFLYYQPTYSVITNIDREHLDYYHEFDYIKEAFRDFMLKTKDNGIIFYNGDDHNLKDIKRQIDKRGLSFGLSKYNDVYPRGVKLKGFSSEFNCIHKGKNLGQFCLNIPGLHNISNSLVVIALGLELGLAPDTIRKSLGSYRGTQRRLEVKLDFNDIKVIDDYAHHPTEIKATLEAVRSLKHNRLLVIFQPHRYSRLKFLFDEFVKVLTNSEHLILSDLYPASEPPIPGITSENLAFKIRDCGHPDVRFVPKSNLCDCILRQVGAGDIVLFMGAGDIGHTADELARRIKKSN
ncbi:MAG: UDP-N-acetylmuramate--L-alanine ligase [Candidatus Omnitrophota bacterium]